MRNPLDGWIAPLIVLVLIAVGLAVLSGCLLRLFAEISGP